MISTSGPHSYRDFIDPDSPMYISDLDVLETLRTQTHVTPFELAESRFRENVIRLQLRDLERLGLLSRIGLDTYRITARGEDLRTDPPQEHISSGLLEVEALQPNAYPSLDWRLNDFSSLDAHVLKGLNTDIYSDSDAVYGNVRQDNRQLTQQRIGNVSDTDIHRVIQEFPTNSPLPEACAHWVRAIVGLHLFPDANHRTATNSLEYLIEQSGGPSNRIIQEPINRFVLHSKYTRTFQSDIRFNTLWARDELFMVWYRYFTQVLHPSLEIRRPNDPPNEKLDKILEEARLFLNGFKWYGSGSDD